MLLAGAAAAALPMPAAAAVTAAFAFVALPKIATAAIAAVAATAITTAITTAISATVTSAAVLPFTLRAGRRGLFVLFVGGGRFGVCRAFITSLFAAFASLLLRGAFGWRFGRSRRLRLGARRGRRLRRGDGFGCGSGELHLSGRRVFGGFGFRGAAGAAASQARRGPPPGRLLLFGGFCTVAGVGVFVVVF